MKKESILTSLLLLVILLLAALVINLYFGTSEPAAKPKVVTGWDMLQPNASAINFNPSTQVFNVGFDNRVGTGISITSLDASEIYTNASCEAQVDGEPIDPSKVVANGSSFKIQGFCNGKTRKPGETYLLELKINYTALIGFINTEYTEDGLIKGEYD